MKICNYTVKDYQDVINFLSNLYQLNKDQPYWLPGRWDYATYLVSPLHLHRGQPDWKKYIKIWKSEDKIIGLVNSESPDDNAYIHIHTDHRQIEEELIDWAESNIGDKSIRIWALDDDTKRNDILRKLGYKKLKANEYLNWCNLAKYNPSINLSETYKVKSFRDNFDLDSRNECASKAFKSKIVPNEVYSFMQKSPSYNPYLDLTIVNKKDIVVSLCIAWLDKSNNIGYFEPVATHPDFQKRGLGKAILNEGLRRLKEMNVDIAYVGASGNGRKAFYNSSGFTERVLYKPWKKVKYKLTL